MSLAPAWTAIGEDIEDSFGFSVATAGDVNGDGYDEIIVGSKYWSDPEFKEGNTVVYWGSPNGPELIGPDALEHTGVGGRCRYCRHRNE